MALDWWSICTCVLAPGSQLRTYHPTIHERFTGPRPGTLVLSIMEGDFLRAILRAKEIRDGAYLSSPYVSHFNGEPVDDIK